MQFQIVLAPVVQIEDRADPVFGSAVEADVRR
jgi:hypothetical protein